MIRQLLCIAMVGHVALVGGSAGGAEWSIPVAGNAFRIDPAAAPGPGGLHRGGVRLVDSSDRYAVFFRFDRPSAARLSIRGRAPDGPAGVAVRVDGRTTPVTFEAGELTAQDAGELDVNQAGYVRVELAGLGNDGGASADVRDLVVDVAEGDAVVDFVRTDDGNMFYWGRRGPSVHLTYDTPKDRSLEYAYSEITVPEGRDARGSYFMANGFGEGYFGIQVSGPEERRVLFSVWSPFSTDDPKDIPPDQRVVELGAGPDVRVGEFGNEGSGGQSFLVYPWKAGTTYRFLTEVKPDPDAPGHTRYTAWFGDKTRQEWRLIASFRRPKTTTFLRKFHSFLENFNPDYGHLTRGADYGNVWVRDTHGAWHECTKARLSADATAGGRHRLDFDGGATGDRFFMRNCGFFAETGKVGETFTRESTAADEPMIDFESLPR